MSLPQPNSSSAMASATAHSPAADSPENVQLEFSPEERSLLLRLAHDSISSALKSPDLKFPDKESREISFDPPTPHLAEPRGVFTSLYLDGQLRGCVGYALPNSALYRAVAETARAAAFDDNRFQPVTANEAPRLEIELSILSPPAPISPEAIEVGRHGLLITQHGRRGLLLPQVPAERHWDRTTFLEQTCRKAGLPPDAWQNGATVLAFTAEVFGEKKYPAKNCTKFSS